MKKVIAIFAIVTLVACGNASTEVAPSADSTAVSTDSTSVDTAKATVDTAAVK